jgi:hypothetical protein
MRIAREIMAQWAASAVATPLSNNLIPPRDYSDLYQQDEQLRIWLPDQAQQALTEICARLDISMTVYLTEFFASYLFGIHEVMRMRDAKVGLYNSDETRLAGVMDTTDEKQPPDDHETDFDDPVPEMGKNIFALKIFLPGKIKAGLQSRAEHAQVSLGRFARAMICAHLFGREVGPRMLMNSGVTPCGGITHIATTR